MASNYLQYIHSVSQKQPASSDCRFLVSGIDSSVRQIVGQYLISSFHRQGKTLLLVDNTRDATDFNFDFEGYRVIDVLSGGFNLCGDLFEVNSLGQISRLRTLLSILGFDEIRAMKVVNYLSFVKETERRLGNPGILTIKVLEEYSGTILVKWKLEQLVKKGELSQTNYEYLLGRYSEVSSSAADFDSFLILLAPFLGAEMPASDVAVHIPVGRFYSDAPMQQVMSKLLLSFLSAHSSACAVLILDEGRGERTHLLDIVKGVPAMTEICMLSNDAFSFEELEVGVLMNSFPARIYTRHEDMSSCEKIEKRCGQIDVVKQSSSVAFDRRIRGNSAWDMLFGTNRTDVAVRNAPTKEARFRKELVHSLRPGTGIVDCGGNQVLFTF